MQKSETRLINGILTYVAIDDQEAFSVDEYESKKQRLDRSSRDSRESRETRHYSRETRTMDHVYKMSKLRRRDSPTKPTATRRVFADPSAFADDSDKSDESTVESPVESEEDDEVEELKLAKRTIAKFTESPMAVFDLLQSDKKKIKKYCRSCIACEITNGDMQIYMQMKQLRKEERIAILELVDARSPKYIIMRDQYKSR